MVSKVDQSESKQEDTDLESSSDSEELEDVIFPHKSSYEDMPPLVDRLEVHIVKEDARNSHYKHFSIQRRPLKLLNFNDLPNLFNNVSEIIQKKSNLRRSQKAEIVEKVVTSEKTTKELTKPLEPATEKLQESNKSPPQELKYLRKVSPPQVPHQDSNPTTQGTKNPPTTVDLCVESEDAEKQESGISVQVDKQ